MNWFAVAAGVLYYGAAVEPAMTGDWRMAVAWSCWATANLMLGWR